jgi:hypothetical protein
LTVFVVSVIEPVQTEAGLVFIQDDRPFVVKENKIRETCKELYPDDLRTVPKTNSPFALEVLRYEEDILDSVVSRISSDTEPVSLGRLVELHCGSDWYLVRQEEHYVFIRQDEWLDGDSTEDDWIAFKLSEEQPPKE